MFDGRKVRNQYDLYVFIISNEMESSPFIMGIKNIIQNISLSSRVIEKEQLTKVVEFPYKWTFLDKQKIWEQIIGRDVSNVIQLPNDKIWEFIPEALNYFIGSNGQKVKFANGQKVKFAIVNDVDEYNLNVFSDVVGAEEPRMQACLKNQIDPYTFYQQNYDEILSDAKQWMELDKKNDLNYYLRETLYRKAKHLECTTFKTTVAKTFNKMFNVKRLLDPSAGWGDRISGAAAAGVEMYHGCDPNPGLRKVYDNIVDFLKIQRANGKLNNKVNLDQYGVLTEDFLKETRFQDNFYDMVFTSPPFYDYEIYVQNLDDPKQSIFMKRDVDSWLNEFLFPYLNKAWNKLVMGGRLALYISDPGPEKFMNSMFLYIKQMLPGSNYRGVISVTDYQMKKANPIWIWQKMSE